VLQAILTKQGKLKEAFTISGDGKQVRDVLFASDLVNCYYSALKNIDRSAGQAFNIGGGIANSLSLLELFAILEKELGVKLKYTKLPWRTSDQRVFVADISKARKLFDWAPKVDKLTGLRRMIEWVEKSHG
jgi:CDP-paratose 2-epimerase